MRKGENVIRKHNRRAAKAAFAVAIGVALVLGGAAAAPAAQDRDQATPIVIGTKNFTEQYVLGQLYKQALEAKGLKVGYKENIASTEVIVKSLTSGKITAYPEYTGVMLTVTFGRKSTPKTANATYALAKSLWGKRGYALGKQTPFQDVDAVAVLRTTATKYGLKTVGDLKKVPSLTLAAFPEFETRQTGLVGMARVYGVKNVDFKPLAGISPYAALDGKQALAAGIFSTDYQLTSTKYVVLRDPKNMFGFQHVAPIVSKKVVAENPTVLPTLNRVSALLTVKAMIAMNKAVAGDKKQPAAVAKAFLKANGLT
jgi:osmoprotectant transport system substrate-binding protein